MEEASLRPAGFPEQAAHVAESLWPMALGSPSNSEWEREHGLPRGRRKV